MSKIKILIVEDSRMYQLYLKKIIESDSQLEVGGIAATGKTAIELINKLRPDVITLDLNLPDVSDYWLLEEIVGKYDIPVIVVTSNPAACEAAISIGAKDFIEKIQGSKENNANQFATLLKMKIKMQASSFSGHVGPINSYKSNEYKSDDSKSIIAIGASLGGTEAIYEIIKALPKNMPGIVVVQHMPEGFTKAYALRLEKNCQLKVSEAKNGDRVITGRVYIAKGGEQLSVIKGRDGYSLSCEKGEKVNGFAP